MKEPSPCYQCPERCVGCHGKNPDGTWRCGRYQKMTEKNAAELAARTAINNAERDIEVICKPKRRRRSRK